MAQRGTLLLCTCLLAGCHDAASPVLRPPPQQLGDAPREAPIGGVTVRLEPFLWRDFQPISPPDGKPLIALLRVRTVGGAAIPAGLVADTVWVINGDTAWVAAVAREYETGDSTFFDVIAREGPKWGPGIDVDVVVRLRDASTTPVYLRANAQPIHQTS